MKRSIARMLAVSMVLACGGLHAQPMGHEAGIRAREAERPRPIVRTVISETTPRPVETLLEALTAENPVINGVQATIVVELCNVDLDFTGQPTIVLGGNRSLIASPGCARGPRRLGPQLHVKRRLTDEGALFEIRRRDVRFAGFRLRGPNAGGIWGGDENRPIGIQIDPFDEPVDNIEISNMEVYHWSGEAIKVVDNTESQPRGRLFNTNERAVRVRDSYMHDNAHDAGYGYGVNMTNGAYALIERNVFERNRHAVAGGSRDKNVDFSGYTMRENLVLPGGGKHCLADWGFLNCWYTHQVDMHGDDSFAWIKYGDWCCGNAGETMIIERNTILYTGGSEWNWGSHGYAIKIRGNPKDKALVTGNVFKHGTQGDAIAQNGWPPEWHCSWWPPSCAWFDKITRPIDVRPNNRYGADPMATLGTCNFEGSGQPDEFMATGVTWWARSKDTGQWRFLNTMPETLGQLTLVDLDRDGKCDVAERPRRPEIPPRRYSKGGTGPWQLWLPPALQ